MYSRYVPEFPPLSRGPGYEEEGAEELAAEIAKYEAAEFAKEMSGARFVPVVHSPKADLVELIESAEKSEEHTFSREENLIVPEIVDPIGCLLVSGGMIPVGIHIEPRVCPLTRDYTILSRIETWMYRRDFVVSVEVPNMGVDVLTKSHVVGMLITAPDVTFSHGTGDGAYVLQAIREKKDGVEVHQIVVETLSGKYGLLLEPEGVREVSATGAATYERVDGIYYLLRGKASTSFPVQGHPWYSPSKKFMASGNAEGVIWLLNNNEYKVRRRPTATLLCVGGTAMDSGSKEYVLTDHVTGLWDCEFFGTSMRPVKYRPDKLRADSTQTVLINKSALSYESALQMAPDIPLVVVQPRIRKLELAYANVVDFRSGVILRKDVCPYKWQEESASGDNKKRKEISQPSLARELFLRDGSVTMASMDQESSSMGIYFRGAQGMRVAPRRQKNVRIWEVRPGLYCTDRPTRSTFGVFLTSYASATKISRAILLSLMRPVDSAPPILVLYFQRTHDLVTVRRIVDDGRFNHTLIPPPWDDK